MSLVAGPSGRLKCRSWNDGGCIITTKNINNPLMQEFFNSKGMQAEATSDGFVLITGKIVMDGRSLNEFLLKKSVDLKANPDALDVTPQEELAPVVVKDAPKPLTPAFDTAKKETPSVAAPTENKVETPAPNRSWGFGFF